MAVLKNLTKAGIGGAGAAYRHHVDPDYTGDTAIHSAMNKIPDEAWYGSAAGSLAWKIMGEKNRKRVRKFAKKAGMKPTEYLSKRIPTAMKKSLMKNFGSPKKLATKVGTRLGAAATGVAAVTPHFSSNCFESSAASTTVNFDNSSTILFKSAIEIF